MEHTQDAERIRALEAKIDNLVALVIAQERLIKEYQWLVTILKQNSATLKQQV